MVGVVVVRHPGAMGCVMRKCKRCGVPQGEEQFAPEGYVCFSCHTAAADTATKRKRVANDSWAKRNRAKASEYSLVRKKAAELGVPVAQLRAVLEWWDRYKEKQKSKGE